MKSFCLTWVWLLVWTQACGQGAADPASIQVERTRIDAQRQRELTRYAQEEQACAAKFLANDCLEGVKKRRRETLAELQRQDVALNDAERRRKAAQQLEQRQSKSTQTAAPSPHSTDSKEQAADRLQRKVEEKALAQQQGEASAQTRAQAQAQKKQEHEEQDAAAASKAAMAAKNQRLNQKKKADAAQHKADLLERQKAKTKPQSLPLPDPT
jgi:hypothetical protein